jgi:hypothetical protein
MAKEESGGDFFAGVVVCRLAFEQDVQVILDLCER